MDLPQKYKYIKQELHKSGNECTEGEAKTSKTLKAKIGGTDRLPKSYH